MDKYIFGVTDKTGREIHLSKERWRHIKEEHPLVEEEEIKQTLTNPLKIIQKSKNKHFYYQYFKYKNLPYRYLKVIVRYLNGKGFVITAHFVKRVI
ncbi:hypothetical protein LCGC14_2672040 [marine sediment metagenome]|uniref:Phage-Barnase-EndoU-ColicinE5/D-RelE like nuclease 2 domain-containing protein n=1 Tax=marine sediment metagenome TaxID=412755 RepID=A0A0F8ZNU6_9ZZZZ